MTAFPRSAGCGSILSPASPALCPVRFPLLLAAVLLWLAVLLWGVSLLPSPPPAAPPAVSEGGVMPVGTAVSLRTLAAEQAPAPSEEQRRALLLQSLEDSVGRYATSLQLLGTAPYHSSEDALEIVLAYDYAVTAAAERYGVEKAMLQAVLFQEIRFLNLFDEVDRFVEATHTYLQQEEAYAALSPQQRLLTPPPVRPLVFRLDSSTGLGQIFADTAIQAINWREGRAVYDRTDRRDVYAVWSRLRSDDTYNITTAALVLSHKRSILQEAGTASPSAGDIMQAYNGTGPLSLRYREAVCAYCAAFRQYADS